MNPEYKKIGIEPLNIWMRYEIGRVLKLDEIDKTADTVAKMLAASDTYKDSIDQFVKEYVYNLGSSASVGAKYIIQEIQKAIKELEEEFSGNGRVLIRPSGTEPVIRVMLEGEDQAYLQTRAENLAKLIEKKLK